jgi:hypothetical protein
MKKILSIMMAMLMLALPIFGSAETAEGTEYAGFLTKYQGQGQKLTTDISIEPGELLASLLGENAAAVQDLLSVLGIQVTAQAEGSSAQFGLNLTLSGKEAVSLQAAATENGLVARSNLTGEDTYALSGEELQKVMEQLMQSMGDQGNALNNLLSNPQEALAGAELDTTALMTALTPIMTAATVEEVTEAPAGFPDAKTVTIVPLKKDDLTNVMTELGKLLWSIPTVQQLLSAASSETPVTEESLIQNLTQIPAAMKEDTELRIYTNAAQDESYIVCGVILVAGEDEEANISYTGRTSNKPEGSSQSHHVYVSLNGVYTDISVTAWTSEHNVMYTMSANQTREGTVTQAIDFSFDRTEDKPDDKNETVKTDIVIRVKNDPSANPIGITISSETESKDLDDHAESTNVLTIGLENAGTLVTVHTASVTGPADAYMTDEGAIHPLSMSEEEQNALSQKLMGTLQTGLMTLMQQLPPSILQMITPSGK